MSEEVVVNKETVGFISAIIAGLASLLFQGRKIGRVEERFEVMQKTLNTAVTDIAHLKDEHEKDIHAIQNWFRTDSGGQKFMTFPDHDLICNRNSKATTQALGQMTEAMKALTTQVSLLGDQVGNLKVAVAVLQETQEQRRKNHG